MLGNLSQSLNPSQKLYRVSILSIILYGFLIWFYNKAFLGYPLKILRNMQQRAAQWIPWVFYASSSLDIKAIVGLIPIHLYF